MLMFLKYRAITRAGRAGVLLTFSVAPTTLLAQEQNALDKQSALESLVETVIVTGSRASGRTLENSPAPIDVLSTKDIEKANKIVCWKF